MPHDTPLIATIVIGLSLAFLFGLVAQRLKLPLIAGYLLAGIIIGPFTPGYVADQALATELAELGVILLMFGVGLHFSLKELLAVKTIAIPGALGQILVATGFGAAVGWLMGWSLGASLIFGLEDGGVSVPRDMAFICKQTSDVLPTLFPQVDTVEEDLTAAGEELTRLLLRRIAGDAPESLQTLGEPVPHWKWPSSWRWTSCG